MPFKYLLRRAARESLQDGNLTKDQYEQIMAAVRHPRRKRLDSENRVNILAEIEAIAPKQGLDWDAIRTWLKENWATILKLILSLVVLLEPPPKDK
jgi:uncharacterized membrane protein